MYLIIVKMLGAILVKFATQEFLEFLLIFVAEIIAKSTNTPHDDEFVAKVKQTLGK